jgi:hypothetical protein
VLGVGVSGRGRRARAHQSFVARHVLSASPGPHPTKSPAHPRLAASPPLPPFPRERAGLSGDWLNRIGARGWLTAGANIVAAPVIAVSLLTPDYKQSFAALLVGFALSEAWRAPAAVCLRDVSPEGVSSTASAVHLCIRNLVGGLGPIAVALLSTRVGLQLAMLLVPACYLASGLAFLATEAVVKADKAKLV